MPTFTESLVALLRQEIEGTYKPPKRRTYSKQRLVARHLLLSSPGVSKLVNEWRSPRADTVDALIDYFGFDRCIANYRRMRREAREAAILELERRRLL